MKKFLAIVAALKERISLCYTASMSVYIVFLFIFQGTAGPGILLSLLLVSAAAGALQLLAFSDLIIKKMPYGGRMAVFGLPFFGVLTAAAVGCGWFPTGSLGAWVSFAAAFLVIFAAITAGIELYYRASGKRYDDRLDWYRQTHR